jgi:hypothetical protein
MMENPSHWRIENSLPGPQKPCHVELLKLVQVRPDFNSKSSMTLSTSPCRAICTVCGSPKASRMIWKWNNDATYLKRSLRGCRKTADHLPQISRFTTWTCPASSKAIAPCRRQMLETASISLNIDGF